eukprot:763102-Hanusia_phi.AAC.1
MEGFDRIGNDFLTHAKTLRFTTELKQATSSSVDITTLHCGTMEYAIHASSSCNPKLLHQLLSYVRISAIRLLKVSLKRDNFHQGIISYNLSDEYIALHIARREASTVVIPAKTRDLNPVTTRWSQ